MITKLATISIDEETGEFYASIEGRSKTMASKNLDILFSMIKAEIRS